MLISKLNFRGLSSHFVRFFGKAFQKRDPLMKVSFERKEKKRTKKV